MDADTHYALKSLYQSQVTRANFKEVRAGYQDALKQFKAKAVGMSATLPAEVIEGVPDLFERVPVVSPIYKTPRLPEEVKKRKR